MKLIFCSLLFFGFFACGSKDHPIVFGSKPVANLNLTEEELYDKVLGSLVGSALGDAMGAPTEMWSRANIKSEYGYVTNLDSMIREASAEGPWKWNLPAGGTTDDTRWKELTYNYLIKQNTKTLTAKGFAEAILSRYQNAIDQYSKIKSFDPEPYEDNTLKVAWLQEWAKVAKPYVENDIVKFNKNLNKFYGGEMVCAGLLIAPAIGAFYPGDPEAAYNNMYEIGIYDIGYARDISALAAALTAAGMPKNANSNDLLATARSLDPEGFFKSRLVGRTAFRIVQEAKNISKIAKQDSIDILEAAFHLLDKHQQDMPFHAGEIYLQVMTAMIFTDFDFQKTMEFLVNYGRDNDTTSAIAGGILGALHGYKNLPSDKSKIIDVNKNQLHINLESLAQELTKKIISLSHLKK
ncbi:MAG: ADP-ribosylglycohydrolase family protein [Saprospiraceae bacterium]